MAFKGLKRKRETFVSNSSRIITKFYLPGGSERARKIIERVVTLSDHECKKTLDLVLEDFSGRHHNIIHALLLNFSRVAGILNNGYENLPEYRKLLIGAYFTREYSIESAALFNPSIVPHPDQQGASNGSVRFIISLRAVGEGHISSIVFRSGKLDRMNNITLDPVSPYVEVPHMELNPTYDKHTFLLKLHEMEADNELTSMVFGELPPQFLFDQLQDVLRKAKHHFKNSLVFRETAEIIYWVAHSNYVETFREDTELSERVIFPVAEDERNGIEDARFVRFEDDNGEARYYATYTAYSGHSILPMFLETKDFLTFKMCTLNGKEVRDKGMALFPRKVNGYYTMVSRQDGENLYLMQSDNIHFWNEARILQTPEQDWEFIQVGNCGSPVETEEGWLLLTHGVGPLRQYCIGAILLDRNDPYKVIGKLKEPLIAPNEYEREGYVPNVVYTCGVMLHNDTLIIPYAASDTTSGIATVQLRDLLGKLLKYS